jgi:prophage maintenance system killer protein
MCTYMSGPIEGANDDLSRALSEINRMTRIQDEAREMDAGFDGGEWSGPAHDDILDSECDRIAKKYGFENYEDLVHLAIHRLGRGVAQKLIMAPL